MHVLDCIHAFVCQLACQGIILRFSDDVTWSGFCKRLPLNPESHELMCIMFGYKLTIGLQAIIELA